MGLVEAERDLDMGSGLGIRVCEQREVSNASASSSARRSLWVICANVAGLALSDRRTPTAMSDRSCKSNSWPDTLPGSRSRKGEQ